MCQQPDGRFLNYVDKNGQFTAQNDEVNLDDSCARAVWSLGDIVGSSKNLPLGITQQATAMLEKCTDWIDDLIIAKGRCFCYQRLVGMV